MASDGSKLHLFLAELGYVFLRKKYVALVDITDRCNLACKYCYHKNHLSLSDNTKIGEWEERFGDYQKRGIKYIMFVGGEPSLRYDVLQLAEKYFPFLEAVTNGQIKIPEKFNHLISLSLEGLRDSHDGIYGRGSFETAVRNYTGDKRVVIYLTLSRMNYMGKKYLRDFFDFVREMNVRGLRTSFYIPQKGEDDTFVLSDDQRREIGQVLSGELKRKDSVLLATEGMINYMANSRPSGHSREKIYFFDSKGKEKFCTNKENDCSRCVSLLKYNPPFYKINEWISHKLLLYRVH